MAKITKRYCGGRKSPYQLTWSEQGSRHSRFFETERERDEFLRVNDYLEKSSFQSLMKLDMDTISDIARIESMRGKITFREIWEFWERNHTAKRVLKLWDACDEYSGEGNGIFRRERARARIYARRQTFEVTFPFFNLLKSKKINLNKTIADFETTRLEWEELNVWLKFARSLLSITKKPVQ